MIELKGKKVNHKTLGRGIITLQDEKYITVEFSVFFASPFWRKLQNIFGECCISKLAKVAKLLDSRLRPTIALQTLINCY